MYRSVCVDALNPMNAPSYQRLRNLGANTIRPTLRDDPAYETYCATLFRHGISITPVAASESFPTADYERHMYDYMIKALQLQSYKPKFVLLGNEPNAERSAITSHYWSRRQATLGLSAGMEWSSWDISPVEFAQFFAAASSGVRAVDPSIPCLVGGMLGRPDAYIRTVYQNCSPDGVDIHYPDSEDVFKAWAEYLQDALLTNTEWCYSGRTVKRQDVTRWLRIIERYCSAHSWFDWGYDITMALVSPTTGAPLKAWHDLNWAYGEV